MHPMHTCTKIPRRCDMCARAHGCVRAHTHAPQRVTPTLVVKIVEARNIMAKDDCGPSMLLKLMYMLLLLQYCNRTAWPLPRPSFRRMLRWARGIEYVESLRWVGVTHTAMLGVPTQRSLWPLVCNYGISSPVSSVFVLSACS